MATYILRRIIQTIVVVLFLSFFCYGMLGLMPGDPLDIACQSNPHCTPETLVMMKHNLGLDRPILVRYAEWFGNVLQGDLGYSRTYRLPVADIILPRLGNTMILSLSALFISFLVAIPLGIFSALKPNSVADYIVSFFAFVGISTPSFWLGIMLIIFFAVKLGWLPAGGTETIGEGHFTGFALIGDRAKYLLLPTLSLSLQTIAQWSRFTRSSMLETMRHDYIRTAYAKGLRSWDVIVHHGLRNSLLAVATVIALSFGGALSGAVFTETVFSYQGVGKLIFEAIIGNDFNVAMVGVVIGCVAVLIMNLVADILQAYLDPRISLK